MKLNRVSLNVVGLNRIGLNRIGSPSRGSSSGSDRSYIDPEVLASLKAVCICYGKSNDDSDRAIVKNLVDPDNPFVISNAAYEGMSGCNGYPVVFGANKTWKQLPTYNSIYSINDNKIHITKVLGANRGLIFSYVKQNDQLYDITEIPSFKIRVSGLKGDSKLRYSYIKTENAVYQTLLDLDNGIHKLPKSLRPTDSIINGSWIGFTITPIVENEITFDCDITIEVLPEYEGAFVTDGIDDLIKSTKSATEMLDGSNEVTVVSMIHQIKTNDDTTRNNWFFTPVSYLENRVVKDKIGKTGIYGYTSTNVTNAQISDITPILGDKNDYTLYSKIEDGDRDYFTVEGFQNQEIWYVSSIAWYWTIIANKVLTTDQINQVIAYFNLDRTLKPDILCNTIKQGITNENHAEFGDKLIDFSGNGRDIQLNNLAWKGDSGIGKYEVDFLDSSIWNSSNSTITSSKIDCKNAISHIMLLYYSVGSKEYPDIPSFKVIKTGADIDYSYIDETGSPKSVKIVDGVNVLPASHNTLYSGSGRFCGFGNPGMGNSVTITQIPSHAGALCLDGINDFGKVTGMPIYKDYTFIIDYERISYTSEGWGGAIVSKSPSANNGAFISMMANSAGLNKQLFSFGGVTAFIKDDLSRILFWQTKYKSENTELTVGEGVDGDTLWLGTLRDNDSRFFNGAIYSLMSFPYSMNKYLIERQLKKHKLGTLYPNMVEFRPIVKSNSEYQVVDCYIDTLPAIVGNYYPINSKLRIAVTTKGEADEVTSLTINGTSLGTPSVNGNRFTFKGTLPDKSPQKINITIDEYIRYEDIVQPYPVFFEFTDENGNLISWGGKAKVGSTITRTKPVANANLLAGMYNTSSYKLNGKPFKGNSCVVEKQMIFTCTATWAFDNNEPNCILSPRLLRIPNSSYKILGHIPDISGHGNHGVIHNSAYEGASGANGYLQNFSEWTKASGVSSTDSVISSSNNLVAANGWIAYVTSGTVIPTFKVEISGIPVNGNLRFEGSDQTLVNGVNTIQGITTTKVTGFYISSGYDNDWSNLKIEQIGEYEGAYCLDGVDDFVTIPTLSSGGKQVLMKVNWQNDYNVPGYMYDSNTGEYRNYIIKGNKEQIAYENASKTYIDGIQNSNITSSDLKDITHNITSQFNGTSGTSYIGCRYSLENFLKMALYDFMLFDEISTDDKIKQLNEYVGIEGNVWGTLTQLSNSTLISNETLIKNE